MFIQIEIKKETNFFKLWHENKSPETLVLKLGKCNWGDMLKTERKGVFIWLC